MSWMPQRTRTRTLKRVAVGLIVMMLVLSLLRIGTHWDRYELCLELGEDRAGAGLGLKTVLAGYDIMDYRGDPFAMVFHVAGYVKYATRYDKLRWGDPGQGVYFDTGDWWRGRKNPWKKP
jgi:hypothetical protein